LQDLTISPAHCEFPNLTLTFCLFNEVQTAILIRQRFRPVLGSHNFAFSTSRRFSPLPSLMLRAELSWEWGCEIVLGGRSILLQTTLLVHLLYYHCTLHLLNDFSGPSRTPRTTSRRVGKTSTRTILPKSSTSTVSLTTALIR
jgi:hypothetical protein